MLAAREVERFISGGFVYLPEAFPRALADECRGFLWREAGLDPFLAAAGDRGMSFGAACAAMDAAGKLDSPDRGLALAAGRPGDVYLCHPFLIHAAQKHRGREPRFMAQPPLDLVAPLELRRADGAYSPVELAVLRGLGTPA